MDSIALRRTLGLFSLFSLAAVAAGSAIIAQAGLGPASWLRNPVAWAAGALLAAGVLAAGRRHVVLAAILVLAVGALATTFAMPAQHGIHRWLDLGPLDVNVAALLLAPALVALAFLPGAVDATAGAAAILLLLILQPDASQATGFAAGAVVLLLARRPSPAITAAALAALAAAVAAAWLRPDPLAPVPEVEGIFALGFGAAPWLAALAAAALAAVALAPLAAARAGAAPLRAAAAALVAYIAAVSLCPLLGAYPVPLVGLGISFPVGLWLAVALLCARGPSART